MHPVTVVRRSPKSVRASRLRGASSTMARGTRMPQPECGVSPNWGCDGGHGEVVQLEFRTRSPQVTITTSYAGKRAAIGHNQLRLSTAVDKPHYWESVRADGCRPATRGNRRRRSRLRSQATCRQEHPPSGLHGRVSSGEPSERATISQPKAGCDRSAYRMDHLSVNGLENPR